MGINTRNVKLLAFAMGASFGGIAGRHLLGDAAVRQPGELRAVRVDHRAGDGRAAAAWATSRASILGAILLTLLPEVLRSTDGTAAERAVRARARSIAETVRLLVFGHRAGRDHAVSGRQESWPSALRKRELETPKASHVTVAD